MTDRKRGEAVVQKNFAAVDTAVSHLHLVNYPSTVSSQITRREPVPADAPDYVRETLGAIIDRRGDQVPVSQMPRRLRWIRSSAHNRA